MPGVSRSLGPLRHQGFRLLTGGQLASNLGDAFYAVALPWYVLAHHGGALLLGTVLAAYGIPRTVLLAAGGHASDRWRPWTVMMVADTLRAVAAAALAAAVLAGLCQHTWRTFGATDRADRLSPPCAQADDHLPPPVLAPEEVP